jgi:hypothetical protein
VVRIAIAVRPVRAAAAGPADDPLAECAALDTLTGAQHRAGAALAAAGSARLGVDLLRSVRVTPATAFEFIDGLVMAAETSIGVGDLPAARQFGRRLRDLPLLSEVGHFATSRLLMANALAGHAPDVIQDSSPGFGSTGTSRRAEAAVLAGHLDASRLITARADRRQQPHCHRHPRPGRRVARR